LIEHAWINMSGFTELIPSLHESNEQDTRGQKLLTGETRDILDFVGFM